MSQRASHDVVVDICDGCGGLWLDAGEFDQVVGKRFVAEGLEAALDKNAKLPDNCRFCKLDQGGRTSCKACGTNLGLSCPADGRAMYIVVFDGIEFDRCPQCKGIWIDGFEREQLGDLGREHVAKTSPMAAVPAVAAVAAVAAVPAVAAAQEFGDWSTASDWASAPQGSVFQRQSNSELRCEGCGVHSNRYSTYEIDNKRLCDSCYEKRRAQAAAPAPLAARASLATSAHVSCKGCQASLSRYRAWEFSGEYWCLSCAESGPVKGQVEAAVSFAQASAELEHKKVQAEFLQSSPSLQKGTIAQIRYGSIQAASLARDGDLLEHFLYKLESWFS
ncbi:MAG: zf-TFIIB domain-containing protein [Bradymonadaceae bacterium]|nr:zf-TFIIB domain-containing protein [Lujinxingiaceae bacterium]